ncbi:cytochrome c maturation protein CcmE [Acidobacteriia bacterium AH_259_A11_L15]|nr:cytochrome c maturation protein CcmE [Acidobacteriia bacterium AH_259_A11_L15]
MRSKNLKFIAGAAIILGVLVWLGFTGVQEAKTYYLTIPELRARGEDAYQLRVRVAGDVVPGSIRRQGGQVHFQLHQGQDTLEVVYVGTEPLPDTLVDDAQAIVTGQYSPQQRFVAEQVQAKCASKYEALPVPTQQRPSAQPPPAESETQE